jgi:hypothetical protein
LSTIGYVDLKNKTPESLAQLIVSKVRPQIPPRKKEPTISAISSSLGQEPPQRFYRREGEPARPWNTPSIPEHEKLARGKVTNITDKLASNDAIEVLMSESDIIQIEKNGANYYFQCGFVHPNLQGYFYWDGSDEVISVGNPDGSMWRQSDFHIGLFALELGRHRGDTVRIRITKSAERMSGKYRQVSK